MLDKRAFKILDIVIGMTTEGESAVIEKNEILLKLGEEIDVLLRTPDAAGDVMQTVDACCHFCSSRQLRTRHHGDASVL